MMQQTLTANPAPATTTGQTNNAYAWYALGVMFIVYALNFIDRQILSILAEDIKGSLCSTPSSAFHSEDSPIAGIEDDSWRLDSQCGR
jgi:hypothetical protein